MTTDKFTPMERVVRTDFKASELWNHIESGDAQTIYEEHASNPFFDTEMKAWRENREGSYPSRWLKDDEDNYVVTGEELGELEEFHYEGGYVHGYGHFSILDAGNLGDGHDAWVLFKHKESGRLFRMGGWYSSWDSGEWNEFVEVEPAKVNVVRYKPIGAPDSQVYDNPAVTVKD